VSEQKPVSADILFLATISKGLEKEHESGANTECFSLASGSLWLKDFLTWNLCLIILLGTYMAESCFVNIPW